MEEITERLLDNRLSKRSAMFCAQDLIDLVEWQVRNGKLKHEYYDSYDVESMIREFIRSK